MASMNCPHCHNPVEPGAAFCGNCGQALQAAPLQQVTGVPNYAVATPATHAGETKALLSVILGVISIPAAIIPIAGIILGIVGVVLGSLSRGTVKRTSSTVGIVLSCVGIVVSIGIFTYVLTNHDKLTSTHKTDPALAGAASAATNADTPCYSVGFSYKLNIKNTTGSCDMSAFDGATLEDSQDAYKMYGTKSPNLTTANFNSFAKQAIDQDVASNLAGFTVVNERVDTFAGSQAYIATTTQKSSGVSVVEAAVLHPTASGDNVFVLAHAVQSGTADFKSLEANWQWK